MLHLVSKLCCVNKFVICENSPIFANKYLQRITINKNNAKRSDCLNPTLVFFYF